MFQPKDTGNCTPAIVIRYPGKFKKIMIIGLSGACNFSLQDLKYEAQAPNKM